MDNKKSSIPPEIQKIVEEAFKADIPPEKQSFSDAYFNATATAFIRMARIPQSARQMWGKFLDAKPMLRKCRQNDEITLSRKAMKALVFRCFNAGMEGQRVKDEKAAEKRK